MIFHFKGNKDILYNELNEFKIHNFFNYFFIKPKHYYYIESRNNYKRALKKYKLNFKKIIIEKSDFCICADDNWTLIPTFTKKIENPSIIFHFDYHRDLMDPFIFTKNNKLYNLFNNRIIDTNNRNSLKKNIIKGCIPIGCVSSMFLLVFDVKKIFHFDNRNVDFQSLIKVSSKYDYLFGKNKINIEFNSNGNVLYKLLSFNNVEHLTNEKILIHIDLDYFCNRYNGSEEYKDVYLENYNLCEIKKEIDKLCDFLYKISLNNKFVYTCIGISPSFFPSEYLYDTLYYLINLLNNYNIINVIEYE